MAGEHIFISYRVTPAQSLAKIFYDNLSARGYSVFIDIEKLESGKYEPQLMEAIDACTDFMLLLTPGALDRCSHSDDWLLKETMYALKTGKNVIPITTRGFEWPTELPQGLEILPKLQHESFEHIVADEYIKACFERICSKLLHSVPQPKEEYDLETQEYFNIKTPCLMNLKKSNHISHARLDITVMIVEKLYNCAPKEYRYSVNEWFLKEEVLGSLKGWYSENKPRIQRIASIANALRDIKDGNEYSPDFYTEAIVFAILIEKPGLINREDRNMLGYYTYGYCRIWNKAAYIIAECLDLNLDLFEKAVDLVEKEDNKTHLANKLPSVFESWVRMKRRADVSIEQRELMDRASAMLFDFLLECVLIMNDLEFRLNRIDSELKVIKANNERILLCYKWLKKKGIYLPKHIQEKIYKYIKMVGASDFI